MAANMLAAYYDKECDSSELFADLKISQSVDYKIHLNKYNVISLNIQDFVSLIPDIDELILYMQNKLLRELRSEFIRAIKGTDWSEVIKVVENSDTLLQATWNADCHEVAHLIYKTVIL